VAVGYGEFEYVKQNAGVGLVCCWSLKNPEVSTTLLQLGVTGWAKSANRVTLGSRWRLKIWLFATFGIIGFHWDI